MRELPRLVHSDVTSFNEVNIEARRLIAVLDDPSRQKVYLRKRLEIDAYMMQNPLIAHSTKIDGGPIKISDFLPDRQWQDTEFYRSVYHEMDVDYQMSISLKMEGNTLVAFALNRHKTDFSEHDRSLLAAIQPHLFRAYKNAVQYTETLTRLHGREKMLQELGVGWIDLDSSLRIIRSSPSASSGVTSFFKVQSLDTNRLPPEIEKWVEANSGGVIAGETIAPFVKQNGRDRLTVRMVSDNRFGQTSLLVERFIDADSPEPLQQLDLTKRQAEVLYWVAQGKTNAEIAIILKLSLRTVENHVYSILECLCVDNRTEAALIATAKLKSN
jgi:DNA-binding CsgD family transcriptional regulator